MACFDGGKRSATVWAIGPIELLALQRKDIESFAAQHAARGLALLSAPGRVLAFRIRRRQHWRQATAC